MSDWGFGGDSLSLFSGVRTGPGQDGNLHQPCVHTWLWKPARRSDVDEGLTTDVSTSGRLSVRSSCVLPPLPCLSTSMSVTNVFRQQVFRRESVGDGVKLQQDNREGGG